MTPTTQQLQFVRDLVASRHLNTGMRLCAINSVIKREVAVLRRMQSV